MRRVVLKTVLSLIIALVWLAALAWAVGVAAISEPRAGQIGNVPFHSPKSPTGWYENDTQGVRETWRTLGLTGTGVTIAVLDSGVDFGNPALDGRYAVQPATPTGTQAYVGWPVAFDDRSLSAYLAYPTRTWPAKWGWYANAHHPITGSGVFTFADPWSETDVYTTPGTSHSGRYLLGYHPDPALGHAPVLVADEMISGTYDAVYIDLDDDGAFETRMTRERPVGVLDLTGDGVPDVSAGMVYWIADGTNPPPGAEAVYGANVPVPIAGTLVAFMIDTHGHGTMCAGTAVGDDGGVFIPNDRVASFYTTTYGPLVQGPAPGARVMALGDVYSGGSMAAWYRFTVLGYDGVPGSGDEPQIVTLSFGDGGIDHDGWDWESRYLTGINLAYGEDSPLFIHSAGNGGFGYGTLVSPGAATGLVVGASTQYGTYNAWGISETVSLPSRVTYGDVASFSGRGPGADGTRAVDLVANGMVGTGAYPLNRFSDGTAAYVHWRGTSRSAPAAGGIAALVAQAFHQAHGRFPTYIELRTLLINGAHDLGYDPLVQGAGQANAFRAAQVALDQYGVAVDPPAAVAGSFRGEHYPSFAGGLARGQVQAFTFTVTNPGAAPITVTLRDQHLVQVARYITTVHTLTDTATNYDLGVPDYALNLTDWVSANPDADLMVVRMTEPFEHFDTLPPAPATPRNVWWLMVYNWWDDNSNGTWWDDVNHNNRVDWPGEIDGGDEWMRFGHSDYGTRVSQTYLDGTQQEVRVGRPYARSLGTGAGGIWVGAAHVKHSSGDNRTTLAFEVVFYRYADWPEVTLLADTLHLAASTQATFQATVTVPPDAPYGLHQGTIVISDAGRTDIDSTYRPHETLVPLTWQVWPNLAAGATLGGTPRAEAPYDNGYAGGGFGWGVNESGDWRFYGFDLQNPPPGSAILLHNVWQDYPTDVDTLIFGPSPDEFSTADPAWFGPYGLAQVGGTVRAGSPGAWRFSTTTGDTEDWAYAPARDGLHVLAHQAVLFGGHRAAVPFTTSVGLLSVRPYPLRVDAGACDPACTLTATLLATLDIPGGATATHAFGWVTPTAFLAQPIAPGETISYSLTFTQSLYRLEAALANVSGVGDLDLFLYGGAGAELARAAWPGVDETLVARALPGDTYRLDVVGKAVSQTGGTYDLQVVAVVSDTGGAMILDSLPGEMQAHQAYTFTVRVQQAPVEGEQGLLVLGPSVLPHVLEIPVLAERIHDVYLPLVMRE